jgi:hypothetical protein
MARLIQLSPVRAICVSPRRDFGSGANTRHREHSGDTAFYRKPSHDAAEVADRTQDLNAIPCRTDQKSG